nr:mast cell protease 1A isoform X1 [Pelodiscus sinensis]|eukprot:XP_025039818.1 mast cell protease 1A isoform X1 [Pelodiscus sinensis]
MWGTARAITSSGSEIAGAERTGEQDVTIVGGHKVQNHSRPYMAFLENEYREFLCDGFLIQPLWVMTAAHCHIIRNVRVLVMLGVQLRSDTPNYVREVIRFYPHPKFNAETMENDLMLLRLSSPVPEDATTKPVRLPERDREIPLTASCSTAGWGRTGQNRESSNSLQEVNVTLVSRDKCNVGRKWRITENMVCAGNMHHNACEGDSGGPLVCDDVAEGVVSFGSKRCGGSKLPTVYTQISRYLLWIKNITQSTC